MNKFFIRSCGNCDAMCDNRSWKNLFVGCDRWEHVIEVIDVPDEMLPQKETDAQAEYNNKVAELRKDLEDK